LKLNDCEPSFSLLAEMFFFGGQSPVSEQNEFLYLYCTVMVPTIPIDS
jgi:hypothetical protein